MKYTSGELGKIEDREIIMHGGFGGFLLQRHLDIRLKIIIYTSHKPSRTALCRHLVPLPLSVCCV